jgi:hypothetical protein
MFRNHRLVVLSSTLVVAAALAGCSSSTFIRTNPPGATLYINDAVVGTTPYYYSDSRPAFSSVRLRMEKPGYEPLQAMLSRDETVEVPNLMFALCCIFNLPFVMGYQAEHVYVLRPSREAPSQDWEEQLDPTGFPNGGEPTKDWTEEDLPEIPVP